METRPFNEQELTDAGFEFEPRNNNLIVLRHEKLRNPVSVLIQDGVLQLFPDRASSHRAVLALLPGGTE